jgi:DNA-binding response OmpR family regulator
MSTALRLAPSYLEQIEDDLIAAQARIAQLENELNLLRGFRQNTPLDETRTVQHRGYEAAFRRARQAERQPEAVEIAPGVHFDRDSWLIKGGGQAANLSPNEAALLGALLDRRGWTVQRDTLILAIWQDEPIDQPHHALRVAACRLRAKLRRVRAGSAITTVPNIGYRLEMIS